MRLSRARIAPVDPAALTEDQRASLAPFGDRGPIFNIFLTLAHAPKALTAFLGWGNYVLSRRNQLGVREREIAILRTGFLCRSGYEFAQHVVIGKQVGLTDAEVAAIKAGPAGATWSEADRALLRAADELHRDQFVTDATWTELGRHFDERQCMDLVFTIGQYTQVSMMLNTFGVQLDDGLELDPDLDGR